MRLSSDEPMTYSLDFLTSLFPAPEKERIISALERIAVHRGRAYLVGGVVRDIMLGRSLKDIDIEVHHLTMDELADVLSTIGPLNLVGKSFGVLKWEHSVVDWSLPRTDYAGRKPVVAIDPLMDIVPALRRRDLTINAMAIDCTTGMLVDPFGGTQDLKRRIARSPDPQFFADDPLRFYRIMQFVGRFELTVDDVLNAVCKTMDISAVSRERIHGEFTKLFLYSVRPSLGIRWLHDLSRLEYVLPEVAATVGIAQNPRWHPEGDVFEHSMQSLDASARLEYTDAEEQLTIMSAVLFHDLGKVVASRVEDGRIRATGHDIEGVPLARIALGRITGNKKRIQAACTLVRYHMAPLTFVDNNASDKAYKRLAVKLAPLTSIRALAMVVLADRQGRNPQRGVPLSSVDEDIPVFAKRAKALGVFEEPEKRLMTGKDFGEIIRPGPAMGKALQRAYEIQIGENVHNKALLKKRIIKEYERGDFSA